MHSRFSPSIDVLRHPLGETAALKQEVEVLKTAPRQLIVIVRD
jgi:hypothetical protein